MFQCGPGTNQYLAIRVRKIEKTTGAIDWVGTDDWQITRQDALSTVPDSPRSSTFLHSWPLD